MGSIGVSGVLGRGAIALGAICLLSAPALTQGQAGLTALALLEPGQWQLRDLDNPRAPARNLCVPDPNSLIQVEHPGAPCSRLVLADAARQATVHYTCPSNGFGRTSLRVETPRLAKIDTQGIIGNAPFALRAEARRVGPCAQPADKVAR